MDNKDLLEEVHSLIERYSVKDYQTTKEDLSQESCLQTEGLINFGTSGIIANAYIMGSTTSVSGTFKPTGEFDRRGGTFNFTFDSDDADTIIFSSPQERDLITMTCPVTTCGNASASLQITGIGVLFIGNLLHGIECNYQLTLCQRTTIFPSLCSFNLLLTTTDDSTMGVTNVFEILPMEVDCAGIRIINCEPENPQCSGLLGMTTRDIEITFTPPGGREITVNGDLTTNANMNAGANPLTRSVEVDFRVSIIPIFQFEVSQSFNIACNKDDLLTTMTISGSGIFIFAGNLSSQPFILLLKVEGNERTYSLSIGDNGSILSLEDIPVLISNNGALYIISCG